MMRPRPVRMDLGWEPIQAWEPTRQSTLHERLQWRAASPPKEEDLDLYGIRVENRLTRQVWHFESVESLYFLSCVEGQFALAGKHWMPGVYDIHNQTADDLDVITGGKTYHLPVGGRVVIRAHGDV